MALTNQLRVLEVVQSLEKGGRTTRFTDTVSGLREQNIYVLPLCLSKPLDWVEIDNLKVIERNEGLNWQLIFKISTIIKSNNINLVHAHCELSQLYAGIASFFNKVKVVGTFHRSDLARYQPNLINKLIRFFVSEYIAVSHDRLSLLTENLNFPKKSCHVVHGGTYIEKAPTKELIEKTRKLLTIPDDKITLLSVGHLGHIKGHQDTITALAAIIQTTPNVHLYIAGDGSSEEKQTLMTQIANLKLHNSITLLGQINNVKEWLCACDIFVQPSIEEAFGLVFIEAGAQAKPVIATNVGGIKEIITDNETGYLVNPSSPGQLSNALKTLITDPSKQRDFGVQGYMRIKKQFSIDNMTEKYINIFTVH